LSIGNLGLSEESNTSRGCKFLVESIYCREDIEGFFDAYLATKKPVRIVKKVVNFIAVVIAVPFWIFAALMLILPLTNGNIH